MSALQKSKKVPLMRLVGVGGDHGAPSTALMVVDAKYASSS